MPATTYSINVVNKSGTPHNYFLFSSLPVITGSGGENAKQIYQNAISNTGKLHASGNMTVAKQYYAICGTFQGDVKTGASVGSIDSFPAQLSTGKADGSHGVMETDSSSSPTTAYFASNDNSCTKTANYSISVSKFNGSDPSEYVNGNERVSRLMGVFLGKPFVGLGALDSKTGLVQPAAINFADPQSTKFIAPVTIYYVGWGDYVAGQVIDVTTVGATCELNFTKNPNTATVTHDSNGDLTAVFS